jgi:putative PLP-dependent aminotransferase (TIGR04422 family)
MERHFLWPKCHTLNALTSAAQFTRVSVIEEKFKQLFPSGYPVLCSSGRAALVLALTESTVNRSSHVGVFPYASHCVLDAIARVATPLSGPTARSASLRVVYHQWGYVQETNLPPNSIEDCVDTLCVPGAKLFPGGGRFEVWSLPKILGVTSGGILWCRDEETAIKIRALRDERGSSILQWILRLGASKNPKLYSYWQGAECGLGQVYFFQTGDILKGLLRWESIVTDRLSKINLIWPLAADWLPQPAERLPCVVPINLELSDEVIEKLGIASGYRMMERVTKGREHNMHKMLPIPIHQDVSIPWVNGMLNFCKHEFRKRDL